jgi:hypothetical protein
MKIFPLHRTAIAALLVTTVAMPALAETAAELKQRIEALEKRIDGLEGEGRLKFANGTVVEIGGYIKTDFIYDFDEALGDAFNVDGISITDTDDNARFRAHARQSRLFFKTTTQTNNGPLKTHIEFDFFGSGGNEVFSNSYGPRLRHAYGTWNGWTVGQTWSNFMPIESYPTTVDFNGPAGIPFVRQAQIRYTFPVSGNVTISASLENSEFSGRDAAGTISESTTSGIRAGIDQAPDFTLAATWKGEKALVKLAGVLRKFDSPTSNDTATGWGVNLSGNASLWEGGTLYGSLTYGDGIGRYLINGFAQDAFVDAAGNLQTIEAIGATFGVSQAFSPKLTGGLALGYYEVNDTFAPTDTDNISTAHLSLFYKPTERMTVGAELVYGRREIVNGSSDDASRLQTSVQFNF